MKGDVADGQFRNEVFPKRDKQFAQARMRGRNPLEGSVCVISEGSIIHMRFSWRVKKLHELISFLISFAFV